MNIDTNSTQTIITYGSLDILHIGHLNIFDRLKKLGNKLIVGVSTDEFKTLKGKKTLIPFIDRFRIVASLRQVDIVIPEASWDQKENYIKEYGATTLAMGSYWACKFDDLNAYCRVTYLPRTVDISSTSLKKELHKHELNTLENNIEILKNISKKLD